ncbi:trypsin-like peptidase domain-containing protein [Streptomyces sp. NPDC004327]|uniref:trypsin-like peptidase domain-containing protein n=1 Tax=Streptomyces sp. NPDC004327 TaxID=3364699 RepID=UPI0036C2AABA
MSHITGTVQTLSPPVTVGPASGAPPTSPGTWEFDFPWVPAPSGTKLVVLHFSGVSLPANNRLEVDLGYGKDVFTSADGPEFWSRPVNVYAFPAGRVPIRYVTDGATTGGATLDRYARGERHAGKQDPTAFSNSDPFLGEAVYTEPKYDPFWFCRTPPNWENAACATPAADVRARVAKSVGMIMMVSGAELSTCSVTLIEPNVVLTAGHCLEDVAAEAASASVTFDYATDCAGNRPPGYAARFHKVVKVLGHTYDPNTGVDYCLLQLKVPAAGLGIPPIPVRPDLPVAGESVFGVHHPNGAVKKLSPPHASFGALKTASPQALDVDFDVSGGSSGSGLFDSSGRIVGILSNGRACLLHYYPTSSMLGQLANPPGPQVNRDVMVVVDRSGSMQDKSGTGRDRTKIEEARDAASLFVRLVRAGTGNRLGLVSFSTTASSPVDFALAPVTDATKNTLTGPAPFTGGVVGGLTPGGATTIGGGLAAARGQFPAPGTNPRSVLLLTDGLQNTPPMIADVEGSLAGIDVNAIGFGTETSLDGALLTRLTQDHDGLYTRAGNGLALKKFFGLAFGNIFEAGALMDPEADMPAAIRRSDPIPFHVCGEEALTVIVGWDNPDGELQISLRTPAGDYVSASSTSGLTWCFVRVPLPYGQQRDGQWTVQVYRPGGGEIPPPGVDLRYFVQVVASGGPRLDPVRMPARLYTGDVVNPKVFLHYGEGGSPPGGRVDVTVTRPTSGAGNLLAQAGLGAAVSVGGDTIPPRQATLRALEKAAGKPLFTYATDTFPLFDDAAHTDGAFEAAGLFGNPLPELLTMEGNYTFHATAVYGEGCASSREAQWTVHVDVSVDPGQTGVTVAGGPDGGTLTLVPRDRYGNQLGPGRSDALPVSAAPGTTVTGPVRDNGDGSYTIPVTWVPGTPGAPGVIVSQPGRPPVLIPGTPLTPGGGDACDCLHTLLRTLCRCLVRPPHDHPCGDHPHGPHDPHDPHGPHRPDRPHDGQDQDHPRPRPHEGGSGGCGGCGGRGGGKGCCGDRK